MIRCAARSVLKTQDSRSLESTMDGTRRIPVRAKIFKGKKNVAEVVAEARGERANRFTNVKKRDERFSELVLEEALRLDMRPWPAPDSYRLIKKDGNFALEPYPTNVQPGDVACFVCDMHIVVINGTTFSNCELRGAILVHPAARLAPEYRLPAYQGSAGARAANVSSAVAACSDFDDAEEPGADPTAGKRAAPDSPSEGEDTQRKYAAFEERGAAALAAAADTFFD